MIGPVRDFGNFDDISCHSSAGTGRTPKSPKSPFSSLYQPQPDNQIQLQSRTYEALSEEEEVIKWQKRLNLPTAQTEPQEPPKRSWFRKLCCCWCSINNIEPRVDYNGKRVPIEPPPNRLPELESLRRSKKGDQRNEVLKESVSLAVKVKPLQS